MSGLDGGQTPNDRRLMGYPIFGKPIDGDILKFDGFLKRFFFASQSQDQAEIISKQSITAVTMSTTFVDVSELSFIHAGGGRDYAILLFLKVDGPNPANMKLRFTFPVGSTGRISNTGWTSIFNTNTIDISVDLNVGLNGQEGFLPIMANIASAAPGTVQLQMAQQLQNPVATRIRAGSLMIVR